MHTWIPSSVPQYFPFPVSYHPYVMVRPRRPVTMSRDRTPGSAAQCVCAYNLPALHGELPSSRNNKHTTTNGVVLPHP